MDLTVDNIDTPDKKDFSNVPSYLTTDGDPEKPAGKGEGDKPQADGDPKKPEDKDKGDKPKPDEDPKKPEDEDKGDKPKPDEDPKKPEDEDKGDKPKPDEDPKKPKKKQTAKERIQELNEKYRDAETRAKTAEDELARLKSGRTPGEKPQRDDFTDDVTYYKALMEYHGKPEPKQEDFLDSENPWGDYNKALVAWSVEQTEVIKKDKDEVSAKAAAFDELGKKLHKIHEDGKKAYKDYEEVALSQEVPINAVMRDALIECDNAKDVLYYLGQNKELAEKISQIPPIAAVVEIVNLSKELSAAAGSGEKTAKTRTSAPDPIDPLKSGDVKTQKDMKDMSTKEYRRKRGYTSDARQIGSD